MTEVTFPEKNDTKINKLLNQNCWSWYHFSQKLPSTLIPVIASTYCGKYAVPFFFLGHPVYDMPYEMKPTLLI